MSTKRADLTLINKKKRTYYLMYFVIPKNHWIRMKEREKIDQYLDLARELKKPWNMKVSVIPVVAGELGTLTGETGNEKNRDLTDHSFFAIS